MLLEFKLAPIRLEQAGFLLARPCQAGVRLRHSLAFSCISRVSWLNNKTLFLRCHFVPFCFFRFLCGVFYYLLLFHPAIFACRHGARLCEPQQPRQPHNLPDAAVRSRATPRFGFGFGPERRSPTRLVVRPFILWIFILAAINCD